MPSDARPQTPESRRSHRGPFRVALGTGGPDLLRGASRSGRRHRSGVRGNGPQCARDRVTPGPRPLVLLGTAGSRRFLAGDPGPSTRVGLAWRRPVPADRAGRKRDHLLDREVRERGSSSRRGTGLHRWFLFRSGRMFDLRVVLAASGSPRVTGDLDPATRWQGMAHGRRRPRSGSRRSSLFDQGATRGAQRGQHAARGARAHRRASSRDR